MQTYVLDISYRPDGDKHSGRFEYSRKTKNHIMRKRNTTTVADSLQLINPIDIDEKPTFTQRAQARSLYVVIHVQQSRRPMFAKGKFHLVQLRRVRAEFPTSRTDVKDNHRENRQKRNA